jgi:serine/threonine protein kinase
VAEGLNYIHKFSVPFSLNDSSPDSAKDNITLVHGDLKPVGFFLHFGTVKGPHILLQKNVLVDEHGVAKICDFGLVRLIIPTGTIGIATKSGHTGTPRYLSYELVNDDASPTQASDVHALGCIGMEVSLRSPQYRLLFIIVILVYILSNTV